MVASERWLGRGLTGSVYLLRLKFNGQSLPARQMHWWFYNATFRALFFALKYVSGCRCLFNALHPEVVVSFWTFSANDCVWKSFFELLHTIFVLFNALARRVYCVFNLYMLERNQIK